MAIQVDSEVQTVGPLYEDIASKVSIVTFAVSTAYCLSFLTIWLIKEVSIISSSKILLDKKKKKGPSMPVR